MIHTYTDITINQFSKALKNSRYISTIWLPKRLTDKLFAKITTAHNKKNKVETENKDIIENYYKTSLYIRILILQTLLRSLRLGVTQDAKNLYKHYILRGFTGDFKILERKIKRLEFHFDSVNENKEPENFDFDNYIASLEFILNIDLGNKFLRNLKIYEQKAVDKLKVKPENNE